MRHLKTYRVFESNYLDRFSDLKMFNNIKDILLELEDNDIFRIDTTLLKDWSTDYANSETEVVDGRMLPKDRADYLEIYIVKKGSKEVFLWSEVKEYIIRLCEYYYSETENTPGIDSKIFNDLRKIGINYKSNSPFRMFHNSYDEFGIGWHKEEDFKLDDSFTFTSLKIIIKLT